MKSKMSFSKRDVVVVLGCIVFLLATLGAVGSSGRRRAKAAVCLSNLRQWGSAFHMFAEDNEGYFMEGWTSQQVVGPPHKHYWMEALRPYYVNPDLRCCPEAAIPGTEIGSIPWGISGTFTGWGIFPGECGEPSSWQFGVGCDYGSYGINAWVHNIEVLQTWGISNKDIYWRTPNVVGGENTPLFGDHHWVDCWSHQTDEPPEYDGQPWNEGSQMGRICMNRHSGFVDWVFLDGSARKVGLKELWTLKWHREYDTCGEWTKCGGVEAEDWPEWMQDFEDY